MRLRSVLLGGVVYIFITLVHEWIHFTINYLYTGVWLLCDGFPVFNVGLHPYPHIYTCISPGGNTGLNGFLTMSVTILMATFFVWVTRRIWTRWVRYGILLGGVISVVKYTVYSLSGVVQHIPGHTGAVIYNTYGWSGTIPILLIATGGLVVSFYRVYCEMYPQKSPNRSVVKEFEWD